MKGPIMPNNLAVMVRAYMQGDERRLLEEVKTDGRWDFCAWDVLYSVLCIHGPEMGKADPAAAVKYTCAVKLTLMYLAERPRPECYAIVQWRLDTDLANLRRFMQVKDEYRAGIRQPVFRRKGKKGTKNRLLGLFEVPAFTEIEMRFLDECVRLCTLYYDQATDRAPEMTMQEAAALLDMESWLDEIVQSHHSGTRWRKRSFKALCDLLEDEAYGMREASPFAARFYAEILKMIIEYLCDYPRRRGGVDELCQFVVADIQALEDHLKTAPDLSAFESGLLHESLTDCKSYLHVLQKRLSTT